MFAYVSLGLGIALTLSIGTNAVLLSRVDATEQRLLRDQTQLAACGARLQKLLDDLESDNAIDQLPDSALTAVPDHWLRPTGTD